MRDMPVALVVVVVLLRHSGEQLHDAAREDAAANRKAQRDENVRHLHLHLLLMREVLGKHLGDVGCAKAVQINAVDNNNAANTGPKQTGHSVQRENAAGVHELDLLAQEGPNHAVARDREQARQGADESRPADIGHNVGAGANRNAARQGRVLDVHHVEMAVLEDARGHKCGHARGGDRGHGVENRACLQLRDRDRGIEARPQQPQEHGADHCKRVVVWRGLFVALVELLRADDHGHREAEECAKLVDKGRAAHIDCAELEPAAQKVDAVDDDLKEHHDKQLQRGRIANDCTNTDHDGDDCKVRIHGLVHAECKIHKVAMMRHLKEREHKQRPLEPNHGHHERHACRRECRLAQKRHQKPKSKQHHKRDISSELVVDDGVCCESGALESGACDEQNDDCNLMQKKRNTEPVKLHC
eukprot:comp21921_c0_seq6/m.49878 comp21921_c0_seq6/g.49878  ORF comp21921_c0_seq6/g.49878 comp21921_c0_seq6/m.49878 type:complete len:415 (-) comp21921_c0_seq6:38-1282(-)